MITIKRYKIELVNLKKRESMLIICVLKKEILKEFTFFVLLKKFLTLKKIKILKQLFERVFLFEHVTHALFENIILKQKKIQKTAFQPLKK